jgi:branched-chain amino acid transport system substrate-binding protein
MIRRESSLVFRLCAFYLLLFLGFASCLNRGGETERYNTAKAETITIGVAYPASQAAYGGNYGYELAVKEVNEAGGVLGKPISLLIRDDRGDPHFARQIVQTFHDTGITAVIGHGSENVSFFVKDIYEELGIVMIVPNSTNLRLFDLKRRYVFRMIVNSLAYARTVVEFAEQNGIRRPAIYYDDDESSDGHDLARVVESELMKRQIRVADRMSDLTPANIKETVYRWRAFGADALILAKHITRQGEPIKLVREAGMDFPIICLENEFTNSGGRTVSALKKYSDNLYAAGYGIENIDPAFLANFRSIYGYVPNPVDVADYEAVHLLSDAMNAEGSVDSDAIANYLRNLKDYPSVLGAISYNPSTQEFDGRRVRIVSFKTQSEE